MIYDSRPCELGEGALWHPVREQLFWFDILNRTLHSQTGGKPVSWTFPDMVSAAGWVNRTTILLVSESSLSTFDLDTAERSEICPVGTPETRSNDGRADRQGGFWFGTMGRRAEKGMGAIWRWYRGELRQLFHGISIPNAICFSLDGRAAQFADTVTGQVMKVSLDAQGWPVGRPQVWLDLTADGLNPDGAVIDAEGRFWNAQWGAGRVAAYAPDGSFVLAIRTPGAPHSSCPAFGGPDMKTLFVTTALEHLDAAARVAHPASGQVFAFPGIATGGSEPQVILP